MCRKLNKRIALIGAMGSGKSTLALALGARMGETIFDTDSEFVRAYGDINAYFEHNGEHAFREVERQIVLGAVNSDKKIIACGGGVVLDKRNMNILRKHCDIVWLTAPLDVLAARIENSNRPLKADIKRIAAERMPLYQRYADYKVDTSMGGGVDGSVDDILAAISIPRPNRYDVLLCDADDTVLDFQKAMRVSVLTAARAVGIRSNDDRIISCYKKIIPVVWGALERKEITRAELNELRFGYLRKALNENFDIYDMNRIYVEEIKKTRYTIDGATEFLSEVRNRGIKVYIVTNSFTAIAVERLKAVEIYVDGMFISEEIGYDKPDVKFFEHVLSAVGVKDRRRALVFGDGIGSDILGGINSNIDTCLFDCSGEKESEADYSVCSYEAAIGIL